MNAVFEKLKKRAVRVCLRLWERLYRYHYGLGIHTWRLLRRIGRRVWRGIRPLRHWARYLWMRRVVRPVHRFVRRQKLLGTRIKPAFRQLREAAKKSFFSIFPCFWHLCRSAVKNYWDALSALGRLVGPITAAAVLAVTLGVWSGTDFCLSVTYQGQELGLVESAAVYDRGAALARGRVINADDSFEVDAVPTFTMTLRRGKATLSDHEVCDAILRQSGDSIAQVSGLYVDGVFVGAMEDEADIVAVLDALKADRYDENDPHQRAEFVQTVEIVEGLYPISAVAQDPIDLTDILTTEVVNARYHTVRAGDTLSTIARQYDITTADLRELNPQYAATDTIRVGEALLVQRARARLQVQVVTTKVETEEIPYKTKTVYRDDKPATYNKTTTKGKAGSMDVTYEYVHLDGEFISSSRVLETVTKEPVTEVIERGTKKTYAQDGSVVQPGDGIATGKWTWPVPVCRNVYQGYHSGHLAWDISSGPIPVYNKPCLAVDGGKVVYAGWYYNYGYYVKIDHGNGLYSVYAHLKSISVVEGQLVSNGQQIGRIGNTGYSFGPHLHLEVIKNGVKVNPNKYLKP
ncbi:MAG: M23 family metallopeptidase [Clostridia bacterium]|nr:M23 family metallopeptidase [Clostridia bacterium]